jgi:hypothetical protein
MSWRCSICGREPTTAGPTVCDCYRRRGKDCPHFWVRDSERTNIVEKCSLCGETRGDEVFKTTRIT